MMNASYEAYFKANDTVKAYLTEGIFWIADTIEEEVRQRNPSNRDYCLGSIFEIKRIAEESFKDPNHPAGTEEFNIATHRLLTGLQE